jgi:hypothetical protein
VSDEREFTITGIDRETGEAVEYPLTAHGVERIMIVGEQLPDPNDVIDESDDD